MSKVFSLAITSKTSFVLLPMLGVITPMTGAIAQISPSQNGTQTTVDVGDNFINITGGQRSEGNLFHSFDTFDVSAQETANFVTQSDVQNVVGRINSSGASTINGTLQVEGSEANLYLMNPAGILIGPDAQLNLSGGFTATTATSIGFENGRFDAEGFNDYGSLTDDPNAFYFEAQQPGAIVNLGELSVEKGRSLSLIGGTVVNDGKLSAPEGALTIAAVEGGNGIRLTQENQLLSLEIEASDFSFEENDTFTAASISQMLTGGELTNATALIIEDGSVWLENAAIDETGGNTVISQSLSSYSEERSNQGNAVAVLATDDIILKNPTNKELSFAPSSSLSFIADADGDGIGRFLMDADVDNDGRYRGDAINTDGGTIFIAGAGIVAGGINTDLTTDEGRAGGDITLASSQGVSAWSVSSNSYSFRDDPGDGGNVRISAEDGDISIGNLIKTWSWAVEAGSENKAGKGGDITLEAAESISVANSLNSGSIAIQTNNKIGGDISLTAATGDISVGEIDTRSLAYVGKAQPGGTVNVSALEGSIDIELINSSTLAGTANTQNGGTVAVNAMDVTIGDINPRIGESVGRYGTGDVFLTAQDLTVGSVLAIADKKEQIGGNIEIITDNLSFIGGNNSIEGTRVQIASASENRNIRIGTERTTDRDAVALNISETELGAISNSVDEFIIGSTDRTSIVSILPGAIQNIGNRPSINIAGARSLTGPTQRSRYTLTGEGEGHLEGASIAFSDISYLLGGDANDTFTFAEGVSVDQFVNIDGGLGKDTIRFESAGEHRTAVHLETTRFTNIERLLAPSGQSTLIGKDLENEWVIDGVNSGYVNSLRFEGFESITGGAQRDIFSIRKDGFLSGKLSGNEPGDSEKMDDFSNINDVLLGSNDTDIFEITGDRAGKINSFNFSEIEAINGLNGTDRLTLKALEPYLETSSWTINRNGTNAVNGLEFQNFETLVGSAGRDTFDVNGLDFASNITIAGGSSSGNRIVTDSLNTTWAIGDESALLPENVDGKNKGTLRQEEITLLTFSDIQNIQNDSPNSQEHTVAFLNYNSQITESIDSGVSDLVLVGDDINIGHNLDSNNVGGSISGSGRLTIRPNNQALDIELGGTDGRSLALNITDGELKAIQDGFVEVEIGGIEQTGEIRLVGEAEFQSGVVLRSQAGIDTSSHPLITSDGDITLQTEGAIRSDRITTLNGGVRLQAQQDIETGAIATQGDQGITIISKSGSVTLNDALLSSGENRSGDIDISAASDIRSRNIRTTSAQNSGDVTIFSATSGITTDGITTANGKENNSGLPRSSGSVTLNSEGSISIEFIDARGRDNTEDTRINIATNRNFRATGSIESLDTDLLASGASISTSGAQDGSIQISYGRTDRAANLFQIGSSADNGTAFGIEAPPKTAIIAGNFLGSYQRNRIKLFNRGSVPAGILEAAASQASVTTSDLFSVQLVSSTEEETQSLFQQIEMRNSQSFEEHLGIVGSPKIRQALSLQETKDALKEIEQSTQVRPAIVYVYFVPDAASEASVKAQQDRSIQPDDQLEVMVISADGEPVRSRQWGVTREQVDEVNRTLRYQATSQFSAPQQYLPPAQQLYSWIVEPISQILENQGISSLGFVMDTGLRTLPVAALHDGDRYLVENYSLGLLPSVSLANISNASVNRANLNEARILAMGASRFENQPSLPAVDAEVALIANNHWEGDAFLNEDFVLKTLQNQLEKEDYGIVHLATHAVFESGDLENSYIQLWDEKLSLDKIDRLQLDQENLSMIILSACNTAIGDVQAEYGFAGFAVSAGSQSALASLWPVNDEGTLGFMTQFYEHLPGTAIRTGALQQAQIRLINGEVGINDGQVYGPNGRVLSVIPELAESGRWDFSHPFYWSAFTMIGNPW